ncbi:MAG: hypothetical protein ACKOFP_07185, partial [Actinomycetota bacterium]
MTDQTPQDPQERLAAVDPAAWAPDLDIAAIRAKVLAEPAPNVVPLKRRRTAYVVGAVAAGVCLLAGTAVAGAAVSRVTAPSSETVTAAAPTVEDALPVIGAAPNSPQMAAVGGQSGGAAPMGAPEAMSSQPADAKMAIWPGWGSTFEPDPSLPNESGTATGYRLTSEGIDATALAAQLAKAFGIKGEPREEYGSVVIGSNDGSGPMIYVSNDALVSWSFSDPTRNPWNCGVTPVPEPMPAESDGSATTSDPGKPDVATCDPANQPISEQDAVRAARTILASVGVSEDAADGIDVEWEAGTGSSPAAKPLAQSTPLSSKVKDQLSCVRLPSTRCHAVAQVVMPSVPASHSTSMPLATSSLTPAEARILRAARTASCSLMGSLAGSHSATSGLPGSDVVALPSDSAG